MPELPEVEFARRALERWLRGATIDEVEIADRRVVKGTAEAVRKALVGRRIVGIDRKGKWLRFRLDEGLAFSHLGMTGKWVGEESRFERLRLLGHRRGKRVVARYHDPRLFGRFLVAAEDIPAWEALGPDPLDEGLDADALHATLSKRGKPIKLVLLDQDLFAGVGNIQATEALFLARIDPRRKAHSLSRREVGALVRAIQRSIKRTLDAETGPVITYVEEPGGPNPFLVYARSGEPCPRCRTRLVAIKQGGRTTTYCPKCQR